MKCHISNCKIQADFFYVLPADKQPVFRCNYHAQKDLKQGIKLKPIKEAKP